jgi:hypothetical protein
MKLEYIDGCTGDSFTVDGRDLHSMSSGFLKYLIYKAMQKCENDSTLFDILRTLVTTMGKWEDLGICEECGDYNDKYTLELE